MKKRDTAPVPLRNGRSDEYLILVQTPSFRFWEIARYDDGYRKEQPWRTRTNHPVAGRILTFQPLPPTEPT